MSNPVFVSYASADLRAVEPLVEGLERDGFACWYSKRDIEPGANYGDAIVSALLSARVMLLVFSAHSNESSEVKKEVALASQRKIPVVPVRIEDVAPSGAFVYELVTRQWIDLFADRAAGLKRIPLRGRDRIDGPRRPVEGRAVLAGKDPPSIPDLDSRRGLRDIAPSGSRDILLARASAGDAGVTPDAGKGAPAQAAARPHGGCRAAGADQNRRIVAADARAVPGSNP